MTGFIGTVYGRLGKPPREIPTSTGTAMASASVAVDVSHGKNPEATCWVQLLAFGRNAELLLACESGAMVSATGKVQMNRWNSESGHTVEQLQLLCDSLHSARTVKVRAKRRPPSDEYLHA